MRVRLAFLTMALAVASCSQQAEEQGEYSQGADASADMAETTAPDISPLATPGVAFNYAIRVGLPDMRISALQEHHADACEKLGLARCQIVGMRYELIDENRVHGSLRFLLTPDIAREFARSAVEATRKVDGKLIWSEFNGEEVQGAIDDSRQRSASVADRIKEIERELASKRLTPERRSELNDERVSLRQQAIGENQDRQSNERRLAKSPLTIDYVGTRDYGRTPLSQIGSDAVDAGRDSLTILFTVFVYLLTMLLPWLVVLFILIYAWRQLSSRYGLWRDSRATRMPLNAEDHSDDA